MKQLDDTLLMSYVDGELDPQTASEVEAALAGDRARQAEVRAMREDTALVRAAFNHALFGAAPRVAATRVPAPAVRSRWPAAPLAMAASVAILAVGVVIGAAVSVWRGDPSDPVVDVRDSALQRALEHHASGSPIAWGGDGAAPRGQITAVSTYRNASGRFCREFEERRVGGGGEILEAGVACREDDGRWRVRVRYYP